MDVFLCISRKKMPRTISGPGPLPASLLPNNGRLVLCAVLFWIATLICLIVANFQEKDLSFVAVFYGILIVLLLRLVVFSLTSA